MSAHICPVIRLGPPQKIEKADKLVYFDVVGNGPVVVAKDDFKENDLACFIPPESLVDTKLVSFSFLAGKARKSDGLCKIRPVRLRGQLSVGLLIPAGKLSEGDNGADLYRVIKWEEPVKVEQQKSVKKLKWYQKIWRKLFPKNPTPKGLWSGIPMYDINQLYKMRPNIFDPDELMVVTEKLHGTNARYVIGKDGKLWCGSRTMWRVHDGKNVYSRAAFESGLEVKLRRLAEPLVLWGEIVGPGIQKGFNYGLKDGEQKFYCFDIYHATERRFLDPDETKNICHWLAIDMVPIIAIDHWKHMANRLMDLTNGNALGLLGLEMDIEHPREGVVVRPWKNVKETHALDGSRCLVAGKVINPAYLEYREKPGMDEQIPL